MTKPISITGTQARDKYIAGISKLAKQVRITMGPFGQNVALRKDQKITNDGYNIANQFIPTIKDPFERRGAKDALEAATKVNALYGDFTTGTIDLTDNISREVVRYLPSDKQIKAKKTASEMRKMVNDAKDLVLNEIDKMTTKIESKEDLIKSALVSVEDEEIATLLGSTQWDLGPDGIIEVEEVNEPNTTIEIVEGIKIDNGYADSNMVNDPREQTLTITDTPVLLTDYTFNDKQLLTLKDTIFLPLINQKKYQLTIIARAFTGEAIRLAQENKLGFPLNLMNAPFTDQKEVMEDIISVVGGKAILQETTAFEDIHIDDIGFVKSIKAKRWSSIITGEKTEQSNKRILDRVETITKQMEGSESDFERAKLAKRIAQLSNGFAILKVGSKSLNDRKRLYDKCEDGAQSVRLALKGGTIRGAGLALKQISDGLPEDNILKRPLTCINDNIMALAPEDYVTPEWVRDPAITIKGGIEQICALVNTITSVGGIIDEEDKSECKCYNHTQQENNDESN